MLQTYKAILEGDSLKWVSERPAQIGATEVFVTLLEEPKKATNGQAAAEILRRFAQSGNSSSFGDPLEWQKETRQDRPLPGREGE